MDRSKLVAVITGAIAIVLSLAYLIMVQLLDLRGEMIPATDGMVPQAQTVALVTTDATLLGLDQPV
jgi:hypothetical protein